MAFILQDSDFSRLLDKRLTDVWEQSLKDLKPMRNQFFTTAKSDSAFEEFFYTTGLVGDIPEFNGALTYGALYPGFHKKIEHKEYAYALQAQRKLIDDKKWGVLDDRARYLAEAYERTREKQAVRLFTQATSTAFDFMTSEEGKPLCSSTHLTKTGVSTSSGFDNTYSSALSPTALAAARLKARLFKQDNGERYEGWTNIGLVVPDALADYANEISGSDKKPDTANNNINPQYKRYQVIPYMRLDDSDTNDWYLIDLDAIKRNAVWYDRIAPEYKNTVDFDTYVFLQAVYGRFSYGFKDWRWILKSTVS